MPTSSPPCFWGPEVSFHSAFTIAIHNSIQWHESFSEFIFKQFQLLKAMCIKNCDSIQFNSCTIGSKLCVHKIQPTESALFLMCIYLILFSDVIKTTRILAPSRPICLVYTQVRRRERDELNMSQGECTWYRRSNWQCMERLL